MAVALSNAKCLYIVKDTIVLTRSLFHLLSFEATESKGLGEGTS